MNRLDDILEQFAKYIEFIPRGKTYGWSDEKTAIKALFLELIGEDEPTEVHTKYVDGKKVRVGGELLKHADPRVINRNQLRAELRAKVEKL